MNPLPVFMRVHEKNKWIFRFVDLTKFGAENLPLAATALAISLFLAPSGCH